MIRCPPFQDDEFLYSFLDAVSMDAVCAMHSTCRAVRGRVARYASRCLPGNAALVCLAPCFAIQMSRVRKLALRRNRTLCAGPAGRALVATAPDGDLYTRSTTTTTTTTTRGRGERNDANDAKRTTETTTETDPTEETTVSSRFGAAVLRRVAFPPKLSAAFGITRGVASKVRIAQVATGDAHSVAVCALGAAYAWGCNAHGQLGLGEHAPLAVASPRRVAALDDCGWAPRGVVTTTTTTTTTTKRETTTTTTTITAKGNVGGIFVNSKAAPPALSSSERRNPRGPEQRRRRRRQRSSSSLEEEEEEDLTHTSRRSFSSRRRFFTREEVTQHRNSNLAAKSKYLSARSARRTVEIACGKRHTIFLAADGRARTCGAPSVVGLGPSLVVKRIATPTLLWRLAERGVDIVRVAADASHSLALSADGDCFSWGDGRGGRLGHGDDEPRFEPTLVRSLCGRRVVEIACGPACSLALAVVDSPSSSETNDDTKGGTFSAATRTTTTSEARKTTRRTRGDAPSRRYRELYWWGVNRDESALWVDKALCRRRRHAVLSDRRGARDHLVGETPRSSSPVPTTPVGPSLASPLPPRDLWRRPTLCVGALPECDEDVSSDGDVDAAPALVPLGRGRGAVLVSRKDGAAYHLARRHAHHGPETPLVTRAKLDLPRPCVAAACADDLFVCELDDGEILVSPPGGRAGKDRRVAEAAVLSDDDDDHHHHHGPPRRGISGDLGLLASRVPTLPAAACTAATVVEG